MNQMSLINKKSFSFSDCKLKIIWTVGQMSLWAPGNVEGLLQTNWDWVRLYNLSISSLSLIFFTSCLSLNTLVMILMTFQTVF